jgi:hypothetical protein
MELADVYRGVIQSRRLCVPLGLGTVLRVVSVAVTPPLTLLLVGARLVESPRQGGN